MNAKNKTNPSFAKIVTMLFTLLKPYGLVKPCLVLAIIVLQGLLQLAGVTSIFPFLVVAADPDDFRKSTLGGHVLSVLPSVTNTTLLIVAGCATIIILAVSNITNVISEYARARYAYGVGHLLRVRLLNVIALKPWSYFLNSNSGVLTKKIAFDVHNMVTGVLVPLLEAISRILAIALMGSILMLLNWQVTLGAAIVFALYYLVIYKLLKTKTHAASEMLKEANRGVVSEAQETLTGIKTVKVYGAINYFVDRFGKSSLQQAQVSTLVPLFSSVPKHFLEPIAFGSVVAVVIVYALNGRDLTQIMPMLGLIGFAAYRLMPSIAILYGQWVQITAARHSLEEVYDEFAPLQTSANPIALGSPTSATQNRIDFEKALRLDEVSFSYGQAAVTTIDKLSLCVAKNSSLGIIGATGSGKSTLVDLIIGLHLPTSGRIVIDGVCLTRNNVAAWQASIGYVSQDVFLIDDTIEKNIALGIPEGELNRDRLLHAAEAAQILRFINEELPNGFKTKVGERGIRLSGGQRQRIALARALYRSPKLLVLDEATSAVDVKTEADIVAAINNLQGRITMIVVAHRLSTIESCDSVLDLSALSKNKSEES